jgi:hypothetical protein
MAALLARFPWEMRARAGGRRRAQRAVSLSLLGVRRWRLRFRFRGSKSPDTCGVVAGDRLANVIGDRRRRVRAGPERAQADDLLGADDRLQRSPAARAEVAGVRGGVAVTPDASAACRTLEVRHRVSGPGLRARGRRPRGRCARARGDGPRWSTSSCRRERGRERVARGERARPPGAGSRLVHGLALGPSLERSAAEPAAGEAPGPAAAMTRMRRR